ncbi:unnamed protein product [Fusarium graminearum]|uniref:Chromosome 1, complete genome n=1 Tax=Gibberella zeae (strain ATCC MYA-4620 / CBS 123657 / FGSC 9075 / NRRL 31084 / PH-1) TaxID=229533 RepID=A0A0E0RWL9_GIBZE|nr:hypothetical protein FG05_30252 [Fusarium graminearum]CEF75644.1 unnamed protein product [Fusarium graminearum]CZS78924.1 unnamed protein product [Fusarium graminearum]
MSHPTPESLPTKARAPLDSLDAQEWEKFGGSISGGQGTEKRNEHIHHSHHTVRGTDVQAYTQLTQPLTVNGSMSR